MAETQKEIVKAVILVGGPSKGTRFRPLSFDLPKPLFPLAGIPLLTHHIAACSKVPGISEILLIGFYPSDQFQKYIQENSQSYSVPIKYLMENGSLGTAGGLFKFRDEILSGHPSSIILLHSDILCSFPLNELVAFHKSTPRVITILGKQIGRDEAKNYGCLVEDEQTHEMRHYAEKPETFISDLVNCGVYILSPSFFQELQSVAEMIKKREQDLPALRGSHNNLGTDSLSSTGDVVIRLEQDIIIPMAGKKKIFILRTSEFWSQLKRAADVVRASDLILKHFKKTEAGKLAAGGNGVNSCWIVGEAIIHPTAVIHPSAKLGPNVTIGKGVKVGQGARIKNSIILDRSEIKEHACILNSVIGWDCSVGRWTRVEGDASVPNDQHNLSGITIFGNGVTTSSEIVVRNSIILPYKSISESLVSEIVL